jgi:VanZ family protein
MRPDPWTYRFAALAIIVFGVVYGSLYPFHFAVPPNGEGPIRTLLKTVVVMPGRGDFLANVVLYLPIGYFLVRALPFGIYAPSRFGFAIVAGGMLSACIEFAQYYDAGRVPSAGDVYTNVSGTALGAACGLLFACDVRWSLLRDIQRRPFPALLLVSWLGYRLFPYVPTIDLHKYWDTLKALIQQPQFTAYDAFRYTIMWLTVGALLEAIASRKQSQWLMPVFGLAVVFAKILIIAQQLNAAEIAGMCAGYVIWLAIVGQPNRRRAFLVVFALIIYIPLWRLEPFQFGSTARPFGWIPFHSLLNGSLEVNTESYLEKIFYYGSLIWFMAEAGLPLWLTGAPVAAVLLATSYAEAYLPMRSAEVTDAIMALMIAFLVTLTDLKPGAQMTPSGREEERHPRKAKGWAEIAVGLRSEQVAYLKRVSDNGGRSVSGATRLVIAEFIKRLSREEIATNSCSAELPLFESTGGQAKDQRGLRRGREHAHIVNLPDEYVEFLDVLSAKLGTTISRTVQLIVDDFITERTRGKRTRS